MTAIDFEFDYISPYAYLGWCAIHALAERNGASVRPVPVLFAAFLNTHGHKGPAEIPPKRTYIFKDVLRTAALLGVPLQPPPSHPFNPLLALRISSLDMPEATRRSLIDRFYAETWGGGQGVTDARRLDAIAAEVGVPDAVQRANEPQAKDRLKQQTAAAIERGSFGVPSMWAGGELFWGYDSLGHLERFLQGNDPLGADALQKWAHIQPSARR